MSDNYEIETIDDIQYLFPFMKNWKLTNCTFEIFVSLCQYLFSTINEKQMNSIQLILLHHPYYNM